MNGGKPTMDPSRSFKFGIEERILCSSGKVAYNRRLDYILSLNIFHCMKLIIKVFHSLFFSGMYSGILCADLTSGKFRGT